MSVKRRPSPLVPKDSVVATGCSTRDSSLSGPGLYQQFNKPGRPRPQTRLERTLNDLYPRHRHIPGIYARVRRDQCMLRLGVRAR